MISRCLSLVQAGLCAATVAVSAAVAEPAPQTEALLEALGIGETVEIMQEEGQRYGRDLAYDMIPDADSESWSGVIRSIYDGDKMYSLIADRFESELEGTDLAPILEYYRSEAGQEIVAMELATRRAFLDPETEAEATERYRDVAAEGSPLLEQIGTLIADSDLVELNVAGAMNSDLMFYRGLNDGGAFDMTQEEILSDVWAQEEEMRRNSHDWLHAFFLMAYQPLDPGMLEAYAAFYRTPGGRDLNRATFAAFDEMYEEISYLLGLAVAQYLQSEKL